MAPPAAACGNSFQRSSFEPYQFALLPATTRSVSQALRPVDEVPGFDSERLCELLNRAQIRVVASLNTSDRGDPHRAEVGQLHLSQPTSLAPIPKPGRHGPKDITSDIRMV